MKASKTQISVTSQHVEPSLDNVTEKKEGIHNSRQRTCTDFKEWADRKESTLIVSFASQCNDIAMLVMKTSDQQFNVHTVTGQLLPAKEE